VLVPDVLKYSQFEAVFTSGFKRTEFIHVILTRLKFFVDGLADKNLIGIAFVHYPRRHVYASTSYVRLAIYIGNKNVGILIDADPDLKLTIRIARVFIVRVQFFQNG